MRGRLPWEIPAAAACLVLCLVPLTRVPAAFLLTCVLPGAAICRHALGERSLVRLAILGSALSLVVVPAIAVPIALAAGHLGLTISLGAPLLATLAASILFRSRARPEPPGATPPSTADFRPLALLGAAAVAMQLVMTRWIFPARDVIRWKGLPDLIFFQGIYTQLGLRIPPMDPENGGSLLVHNWIYHFHFVLLGKASGLDPLQAQRLASAWLELALLGLLYLLATDVLRSKLAGFLAGLFVMSSGEIYWLVHSLARGRFSAATLGWGYSPMGVTVLFGWYNLAPFVAALAAWYCFERSRTGRGRGWLWASVALCAAMAFFHPIFFAVFMTSFCLWLGVLWLRSGVHAAWLAYLLTPLPFFLLYKIPYYGWSMPPSVVHLDLSPAGLLDRGMNLALFGGLLFLLAAYGMAVRPHGLLVSMGLVCVAAAILMKTPNPHWIGDPLHIVLALAAGAGVAALAKQHAALAWGAGAAALAVAGVALALHLGLALSGGHTFTRSEKDAAAWLRSTTGPDDLVVILPNSRSSYPVIGLANRRVVHGWTGHLLDFMHDAIEREREVASIYGSSDARQAAATATRLGARLVWVGPDERGRVARGRLPDACFALAFSSGDVAIFRNTCGETGGP